MKTNTHPAPQHRLADLRDWLMDRIDGSEETRGEDGLISDFIRQIDAVSSEMGTIPDAEREKVMEAHMLAESIVERATVATPRTDAAEVTMLRLDGDADVVVAAFFARTLERELIDLKQRLLPQYMGRAERAQRERQMISHERDSLLEKLRAATTMPCAPSATAATQDAQAIVASCCAAFDCRPSELLGMILGLKGTAPPVEGKQMNNEDLLTELRWALDNIGASRDYFRIGNALESAIKALSPSATAVDHGYDRTASLNAGHYVCTCGGACSSPTTKEPSK